ncbi:ABC transporter permease [Pedobacter metabolipauper]|uniref:Putative ABC transport system permease protein n=1 Tax=Pedobacter metabolipauper TaxID=425513 RepID=A0A4R6T2H2_9SPHI|nr:FtsX-like permease family protein [Pedobacter metabolipauper]TDQ11908.1 putative ABC transport system permease protein [Pedobacter metabolipauper]
MFKHLFKLIWNKRKQNFLFLSEILVSFMVVFAVFSSLVFYYQNYSKPRGIAYERVWAVSFNNSLKIKDADSLKMFFENVRTNIKSLSKVQEITYSSSNFPYANSHSTTGFTSNGRKYDRINTYFTEDTYHTVLSMNLSEGRWFNNTDGVNKYNPIVINDALKKAMFGTESAVGKLIGDEENAKMKVIGVVQDVKADGDYLTAGYAMYNRIDTGSRKWIGDILIKVSPDADAAFESKLYKVLANNIKNSNIEIVHLSEIHDAKNGDVIFPMTIFIIIAGFLIINVALGLFGVLWYNISKRRGEIGLRRAIGASGRSVSYQLVSESLILATLALIVGTFFAIQFPLLNVFNIASSVYLVALLLSLLFVYLLVFLCSLYPGKQAAAIHPAVALHEE